MSECASTGAAEYGRTAQYGERPARNDKEFVKATCVEGNARRSVWFEIGKRFINDRPSGIEGPVVGLYFIWKGNILACKTVGEAAHPELSRAAIGLQPNASLRNPTLWSCLVGNCANAAAAMLFDP